ncbi:ATP-binding protein [uncultured Bacteroides sp.]|uniref:ATP-binding protein n=1 Tax=uncultured Bacteroides sp. TaxID=162156 RepID=UPI0025D7F1FC|nr:ATP-binding protein [uncultured Bacteroides sp.]
MENILKNAKNAERLLTLTSDTMILLNKEGICVDIAVYNVDLWFLKEDKLLGKNIFELIPPSTYQQIFPEFRKVLTHKVRSTRNYELFLGKRSYYFKCIMYPYDDMVLCQYRDITERSQRKLELEKKNHELNEIQKAALIGRWKYEAPSHMFSYQGHTGIMCSEMEQNISLDTYQQHILREDWDTFNNWLERNLKGDVEESIDYRIHFDNQIFYVRLQAFSRERHKNGNVILEGYVQNITDIQQRRNDINLLTHAINNSMEDIFAAREDGTLVFANRSFKEHHRIGCTEDITQLKFTNLYSLDQAQGKRIWKEMIASARKDTESNNYIIYHPLENYPEILAYEGNAYWVTSDEGVETMWVFGRDISQRISHEQQIKRLNQVLDKIIEHLPAGIVVKDIENGFRYLYRNRESYNRSTTTIQEVLGKDDFDFYPLEIAQEKRAQDIEIAATGKEMHWVSEERDINDRSIFLDKRKLKIESNDFPPILLSIEWDITELERMKRELLLAKEKAETSDQLKSAFLANMSHEIRTPLNAIVGFSRIIAESEDTEERLNYYEIVEANNERLLQLINEILDLSKIESGIVEFTITPVRLHPLCKEIHDAHVFRCPTGVELIYETSDEDIVIEGDKNRIFQVISNLIGNAFKFTTTGKVSYGYHQDGDNIVFHVTDTGIGIAADKVGRVFERFVKVNSFAQGTGLGLSICKTIIERLGGNISVSSEYGVGTTFTFTLPYKKEEVKIDPLLAETTEKNQTDIKEAQDATDSAIPESEEKTDSLCSSKTILVAEDTDCNYVLIKAILGSSFVLKRATDGMEAVTMFEELHPDLILMDMKMPNLGGLDATRIIRELSPATPVIVLTAYAYEQDKQAALEAGCNEFLTKPFTQEGLKEAIKKWLKI